MNIAKVMKAMIGYYSGDIKRINHFVKVYGYAKTIGELEGIDELTQEILEIAAITHDIGIKVSEEKYQSASGHYQQIEGPLEAQKLLSKLEVDEATIDRCCWLIAHHHTYNAIQEIDHQILVEADFLVNIHESEMGEDAIRNVKNTIFKTDTGKYFLENLFLC
jgi:HD superfamily phosphodiesterase